MKTLLLFVISVIAFTSHAQIEIGTYEAVTESEWGVDIEIKNDNNCSVTLWSHYYKREPKSNALILDSNNKIITVEENETHKCRWQFESIDAILKITYESGKIGTYKYSKTLSLEELGKSGNLPGLSPLNLIEQPVTGYQNMWLFDNR